MRRGRLAKCGPAPHYSATMPFPALVAIAALAWAVLSGKRSDAADVAAEPDSPAGPPIVVPDAAELERQLTAERERTERLREQVKAARKQLGRKRAKKRAQVQPDEPAELPTSEPEPKP